jgi:transcriptional regulator with XRE-family HTH domain
MSKKTSILDKEIAQLLKSTREKAGLYQEAVAERIGLSAKSGKGYISHLEKGRVNLINQADKNHQSKKPTC